MKVKFQPNGDVHFHIEKTDCKKIRFPVGCADVIHHKKRESPECYEFRYETGHSIYIYVTGNYKERKGPSFKTKK